MTGPSQGHRRLHTKPCLLCGVVGQRHGHAAYCVSCKRVASRVINKAASQVRRAVTRGELPSPSTLNCADCGSDASLYDHRDYSKPLQVEAVCRGCNIKRGPGVIAA